MAFSSLESSVNNRGGKVILDVGRSLMYSVKRRKLRILLRNIPEVTRIEEDLMPSCCTLLVLLEERPG